MARKIQVKRGIEANLPQLDAGEIGFTTDTKRAFIGALDENVELTTNKKLTDELGTVNQQLAETMTVINVKTFGAVGDGTDETTKIQAAFTEAFNKGIENVFFPQPISTYYTTSDIDIKGRTPLYVGGYFSGTWMPPVEKSLNVVEGFDKTKYRHKIARGLTVADNQNRYWSIIGDVIVPAGTAYTYPHVVDHVGIRGQAMTYAPQSRIWGSAYLVEMRPESKPADNDKTKLPSAFAAEFDVNNNSGLDMDDLTWHEIAAAIFASGGANQVFAAQIISKLETAKGFYAGQFLKDHSIAYAARFFDNVAPSFGDYYSPSYEGGPAISMPDGKTFLEARAGDPRPMLFRALNKAWFMNVGSNGFNFVNNADNEVIAQMTNAGEWKPKISKPDVEVKKKYVVPAGSTSLDASQGNFFATVNSVATAIGNITNGLDGQEITIVFTDAFTTITHGTNIKLSGGANFTSTANDTLTLIYDGVNWFEKGRSVNG